MSSYSISSLLLLLLLLLLVLSLYLSLSYTADERSQYSPPTYARDKGMY